ncbi:MAG: 4-(cytidine 5'-diphospho)-2-C-methyl-D-erythritol kinase [Steroidobacteraceae bacterium]
MIDRATNDRSASCVWSAPAKLNLLLHVTGRRPDGYHELQTIFQLIDLQDEIELELDPSGAIRRAPVAALAAVAAEDDLCVRAARALRAACPGPEGVHIKVHKRIPLGGGLGGGSSDAATTLCALNQLWRTGLSSEALERLGLTLGADVPVFIRGRSAVGEGVGERLTPLELPPRWFLVLHPGVAVPTREVFQAPELTRNSPILTIPALLAAPGRNDCEPVVRARVPEVADALEWLGRSAPARLSGTGACVFASFDSPAAAERVAARVPDRWRAWVVQGLARSPLLAQLAR